MKKELKKSKGITLIALVITIIILLILAGISISALTQTGLFSSAKQAKQKTKEAQEEENETLGTYEEKIDKYLGDKSSTEEKLVDKVKDGIIKIGDYVKYTPDAVSNTDTKYTELLKNSKLSSKVQNIKIEDITKHMTTQPVEDTTEYTPSNINYPKILEQEENQTVVNSTTENKLGFSSQSGFVTGGDTSATSKLKNTYWKKSIPSNDFDGNNKEMYYKLFINNGNNYPEYWMSSRCVNANADFISFLVRHVDSGNVSAHFLCRSADGGGVAGYALRPIITLNSNVQIDTVNSGDGSKAEQGYAIK